MKVDFEEKKNKQKKYFSKTNLLCWSTNATISTLAKRKKIYYKVSAYQFFKNFFTPCFYSIIFCF